MRHKVKKTILNMEGGKQKLLLRNLATSLILHKKVKTTHARAKALQPFIEKLIHDAKNPNKVLAIRKVTTRIQHEIGAKKLIDEIGKSYENKQSGYTRIIKLGFRAGDAAPLVQIELI